MPATTVSVEVEPHDTVIYPADGPNVDRVGAQNLLSHGSTLYLNTGTTHPGLLLSETGGASWRSQPTAACSSTSAATLSPRRSLTFRLSGGTTTSAV